MSDDRKAAEIEKTPSVQLGLKQIKSYNPATAITLAAVEAVESSTPESPAGIPR